MVCTYSDKISRVPSYSGNTRVRLDFAYGAITLYSRPSQAAQLSINNPITCPEPHSRWIRLLRFRSPLLTESNSLSFPLGTKMFQFPRYFPIPTESEGGQ